MALFVHAIKVEKMALFVHAIKVEKMALFVHAIKVEKMQQAHVHMAPLSHACNEHATRLNA